MRKTSQDGGDSSSITSGMENEIKKPGAIMKTKRNSLKRKVQSLSHESDDTVIEPLLQKDKEKSETSNQSAKYNLLSKTKTEFKGEKENDKEKLLQNDKTQHSDVRNVDDTIISIPSSNMLPKSSGVTAPLHNHMNTNVFNSHDAFKALATPKSQILVEIDACKQSGYSPSPLIFTTAKIHTDGKTKHMEPLQVTPVPILSTIEVNVLKGPGSTTTETTGAVTSSISTIYANISKNNTNMSDKDLKIKTSSPTNTSMLGTISDSKTLSSTKDLKSTAAIPNNAKENDIKPTKMSLHQSVSGSTTEKPKITMSNDFKKPIFESVDTRDSNGSHTAKNTNVDKFGQTTKTDLNKNIKAVDIGESSNTSTLDHKSDRDKTLAKTSSIKQLQRQKVAIDKDDSIAKLKLSTENSTLSDSKIIKTPDDIAASVTKSVVHTKSPANDINRLSDKSKLPNSTANIVQITNYFTDNSNISHVTTVVTNTVNKSTTSNSFAPINQYTSSTTLPTSTKATEGVISSSPQQSGTKAVSSNMITTVSSNKLTSSAPTSNLTTSVVSNSSASSAVPSMKTVNVSGVGTSPIISQSISNKSPILQASAITTSNTVTKTAPQSIVSNLQKNTTKVSTTLVSIAKTSGSTSAAKTPLITTDAIKNPPTSASTAKTSSMSTSSIKTPTVSTSASKTPTSSTSASKAISTNTAKSTSVPTSTSKTSSVSTSASKASTVSASIAKTTTVPASVSKSPSVTSTSIAKTGLSTTSSNAKTPVSANTVKTSTIVTGPAKVPVSTITSVTTAKSLPVSTSNAKSSTSKSNTTPASKISGPPLAPSNAMTTTSKINVDSTKKAVETNKKSEEFSNSNKNSKA